MLQDLDHNSINVLEGLIPCGGQAVEHIRIGLEFVDFAVHVFDATALEFSEEFRIVSFEKLGYRRHVTADQGGRSASNGDSYELAGGRSVSKINNLAFHDYWTSSWANEVEFAFEKGTAG